jgi:hypothetical protein
MTTANELSADVATALLVNSKRNPDELLKIVETVHLELRRLPLECSRPVHQQPVELVPLDACWVMRAPTNNLQASKSASTGTGGPASFIWHHDGLRQSTDRLIFKAETTHSC